jgi:hypothetical protein
LRSKAIEVVYFAQTIGNRYHKGENEESRQEQEDGRKEKHYLKTGILSDLTQGASH